MSDNVYPLVRINKLYIKNYKGIDELEIEFPKPEMEGEPDVFVLGSSNGVGKTSVLECCALAFLLALTNADIYQYLVKKKLNILITTGKTESVFKVSIDSEGKEWELGFKLVKDGGLAEWQQTMGAKSIPGTRMHFLDHKEKQLSSINRTTISDIFFGINPNPLVTPPLSYFHSYRKVQEGNTRLGSITGSASKEETGNLPSIFKLQVMQLLMSKVGLFEGVNEKDAEVSLNQLNSLITRYAGGEVRKLKSLPNETIDLLITAGGTDLSYPFDSLSSGQKEIITTLFLIWKNSRQTPGVVLIDEPELHLNMEWHRGLVASLHNTAPHNQYILATHSEAVFASVDKSRRLLLKKG